MQREKGNNRIIQLKVSYEDIKRERRAPIAAEVMAIGDEKKVQRELLEKKSCYYAIRESGLFAD